MPIYEYQCQGCGKELEVTQRITDEPLQTCSVCGGALQRLISNTGFILKGTGWYVTDYARKGGQEKASNPSTDTKPSTGEKKEAPPEAKSSKKDNDT